MKVNVVFYGALKEYAGGKRQTLELAADGVTVADLVDKIKLEYPALTPRLESVAYVVEDMLVDLDYALRDGDEAALLPPVSGG
jgi:molybdopterin converting factor small subunit